MNTLYKDDVYLTEIEGDIQRLQFSVKRAIEIGATHYHTTGGKIVFLKERDKKEIILSDIRMIKERLKCAYNELKKLGFERSQIQKMLKNEKG